MRKKVGPSQAPHFDLDCLFFFVAYVTTSITCFISFEIFRWNRVLWRSFFAALWHCTFVVLVAVVVIYLAMKGGGPVKPWAGTYEDTACKPLGAVIAVWCTAIGSSFIVAIGALGSCTDFNTDLSVRFGSRCGETETGDSGQSKKLHALHRFTSTW